MSTTVMSAPRVPGVGVGRQITAPSGNSYSINGQGNVTVAQVDVAWFVQQGFSPGAPFGANILYTTGVLTGTTSVLVGVLPPGSYIQHVIVQNTTANAVTGGIAFGTTSGGSDIVTALTVGANALVFVADSALKLRVFSTTLSQPIYANAVTSWNSANANITVVYGFF
jgi:hypothetical protein